GLSVMKELAPSTRSSSCWIASLSVDAVSLEARWKARRAFSAFERATARAPSTAPRTPAATRSAVSAVHTLARPWDKALTRRGAPVRPPAARAPAAGGAADGRWVSLADMPSVFRTCDLVACDARTR